MKLLSLQIGDLGAGKTFRSLNSGFKLDFHSIDEVDVMGEFRPFCLTGLNGSGKSNVLEALANIFYHLEICVGCNLPATIRNRQLENFERRECNPDAFIIEYLIGQHNDKKYCYENFHKVIVRKKAGAEPEMFIKEYPFTENETEIAISLVPNVGANESAPGKRYLPDHVIGYSSGENEILSLPFIKARLVHLDEYKEYSRAGVGEYVEPENGMIYVDSQMSQAVLLSCLLLEDSSVLSPLREEIGIQYLESFRMHLNLKVFSFQDAKGESVSEPILKLLENDQIRKFKCCSTSWFVDKDKLVLDFFVGKDALDGSNSTKQAFKHHFRNSSLELFQAFRILYELNNHFLTDAVKEDVYKSKGFYIDGKIPVGGPEDDVFHFLDFKVVKKLKDRNEEKALLLREFSDGEHQLIHTMGICILLKEKRALLLLDEPETHFNPSWRAKFIKMLNEAVSLGNLKEWINGKFNVHLLKDIILTSHSPFVISDCLPNNVIFFDRDNQTSALVARKASEMGINTYGAGVDYILKNIFKTKMISSQSFDELKELIRTGTIDELRNAIEYFGESSQKQFLFKRLFELTKGADDTEN